MRLSQFVPRSLLLCAAAFGCAEPPRPAETGKPEEAPPAWMASAFEQPRGLLRNEPGASPGYAMFSPFSSDTIYLVDLEGQVVHTWKNDKAGDALYLQDDGSLYRLARIPEPANFRAGGIAGAQRLPNGNTFVCSGPQGRYFEVNPEGAIVWEYRSPFRGELPGWQPPLAAQLPYASFRALKLTPDHPGLAGRTLKPLEPQPPVYVPPPKPAVTGGS